MSITFLLSLSSSRQSDKLCWKPKNNESTCWKVLRCKTDLFTSIIVVNDWDPVLSERGSFSVGLFTDQLYSLRYRWKLTEERSFLCIEAATIVCAKFILEEICRMKEFRVILQSQLSNCKTKKNIPGQWKSWTCENVAFWKTTHQVNEWDGARILSFAGHFSL